MNHRAVIRPAARIDTVQVAHPTAAGRANLLVRWLAGKTEGAADVRRPN